jgi:hypothetical protein
MTQTDESWQPAPGITDHSGAPLDPALDFFAAPPAEIGPVSSGWSTLARGQFVWPTWLRVALFAALSLLAGVVAIHFTDPLIDASGPDAWAPHSIIWTLSAAGGLVALWLVKVPRARHECTYVGRDGVAVFTLRSGRVVRPLRVLPFASTHGLYRSDTHQYLNGAIYGGTSFHFSWRDADGQELLVWRGGHTEKGRAPRRRSVHELASAVERAWNGHRLRRAATEVATHGYTEFRTLRKAVIRVAPGLIEIADGKGGTHRLTRAHAPAIDLHNGRLSIRTDDASVFGRGRVYALPAGDVADVAVLLTVVETVFKATFADGPARGAARAA